MRKALGLVLSLVVAGTASLAVHPVEAAENGTLDYAPGAPGPFLGLLPPVAGIFLLDQSFILPSGNLYGADGKKSPFPIKASTEGSAERLIFSYPDLVFGARFYQQVIVPLVNVSTSTFGQKTSEFGVGNILVSPAILSFTLDRYQSLTTGLDIATSFGTYDKKHALNVTNNYTSFQPVVAYRYLDPQGFTLGVGPRLLLNTENDDTHYTSGNAIVTDFDVGYTYNKFRFDVVGSYAYQFEDDTSHGVRVKNDRYRTLSVGPSITYDFGPIVANVNYQFGVLAENTVKSDTLWVNLAIPLYTVPPPGAPPGTPGPAIPSGSTRGITARPGTP